MGGGGVFNFVPFLMFFLLKFKFFDIELNGLNFELLNCSKF